MAIHFTTDGVEKEVHPKKGKFFSYEELKDYVKGYIEIVPLPSGKSIVVNEEGKMEPGVCMADTPKNELATKYWLKEYPINEFPNNNDACICGDALIVSDEELEQ